MGKRGDRGASGPDDEIAELRREVSELRDYLRLVADMLEDIRKELSWIIRNGLPVQGPLPQSPVLKRMARDPTAKDWSKQLVIVRDDLDAEKRQPRSAPPQPSVPPCAEPLPEPTSATESPHRGRLF